MMGERIKDQQKGLIRDERGLRRAQSHEAMSEEPPNALGAH